MSSKQEKFVVEINSDLKDIVPNYLNQVNLEANHLLEAVDQKDYGKIESISHKMKGVAESYGFPEMTRIARQIEQECRSGQPSNISKLVKELVTYIRGIEVQFVDE